MNLYRKRKALTLIFFLSVHVLASHDRDDVMCDEFGNLDLGVDSFLGSDEKAFRSPTKTLKKTVGNGKSAYEAKLIYDNVSAHTPEDIAKIIDTCQIVVPMHSEPIVGFPAYLLWRSMGFSADLEYSGNIDQVNYTFFDLSLPLGTWVWLGKPFPSKIARNFPKEKRSTEIAFRLERFNSIFNALIALNPLNVFEIFSEIPTNGGLDMEFPEAEVNWTIKEAVVEHFAEVLGWDKLKEILPIALLEDAVATHEEFTTKAALEQERLREEEKNQRDLAALEEYQRQQKQQNAASKKNKSKAKKSAGPGKQKPTRTAAIAKPTPEVKPEAPKIPTPTAVQPAPSGKGSKTTKSKKSGSQKKAGKQSNHVRPKQSIDNPAMKPYAILIQPPIMDYPKPAPQSGLSKRAAKKAKKIRKNLGLAKDIITSVITHGGIQETTKAIVVRGMDYELNRLVNNRAQAPLLAELRKHRILYGTKEERALILSGTEQEIAEVWNFFVDCQKRALKAHRDLTLLGASLNNQGYDTELIMAPYSEIMEYAGILFKETNALVHPLVQARLDSLISSPELADGEVVNGKVKSAQKARSYTRKLLKLQDNLEKISEKLKELSENSPE